jgi:hypothetical protein
VNAVSGWTFLGSSSDDTLGLGNLTGATPAPLPIDFDGNGGIDQVKLLGTGQILDLTNANLNQFANLEVLDIIGASPNELVLNVASVRDTAGDPNTLLVRHDDDDTTNYGPGWQVALPQLINGLYLHILRQGDAELRIANTKAWQNPYQAMDVNRDGTSAPIDVLNIVNTLNASGPRQVTTPTTEAELPTFYFDANGDRFVTPQDALVVVNFLNRQAGEAESERGPILVLHVPGPLANPIDPGTRRARVDVNPADVRRVDGVVRVRSNDARVNRESFPSERRKVDDWDFEELLNALAEDAAGIPLLA